MHERGDSVRIAEVDVCSEGEECLEERERTVRSGRHERRHSRLILVQSVHILKGKHTHI